MKILLTAILSTMVLSGPGFAGDKGGNGGDGILYEGVPYVLDLVEAGVELSPVYNTTLALDKKIVSELKISLESFPEVQTKMSQKLTELNHFREGLGLLIAVSFRLFNYSMVNFDLIDIKDENTLIDSARVQLAIRSGRDILLNRRMWSKLNIDHKVALLLHEIIYAYQSLERNNSEKLAQSSVRARKIVGYLFTNDFVKGKNPRYLGALLEYSYLSDLKSESARIIKNENRFTYTDWGVAFRSSLVLKMKQTKEIDVSTVWHFSSPNDVYKFCKNYENDSNITGISEKEMGIGVGLNTGTLSLRIPYDQTRLDVEKELNKCIKFVEDHFSKQ